MKFIRALDGVYINLRYINTISVMGVFTTGKWYIVADVEGAATHYRVEEYNSEDDAQIALDYFMKEQSDLGI